MHGKLTRFSYTETMTSVPPIPAGSTKPAAPSGQIVQIVSLPDALQKVARATRVEGEVVGQNNDGTTRIRTSEGDIDVNIRGRQLQTGAKVELDIPAGNPPRQATVRPAPAPPPVPAPPPSTTLPPTTQPAPTVPLPETPVTRPPPVTGQPQTPAPLPGTPQTPAPVTTHPLPATPVATQPANPVPTLSLVLPGQTPTPDLAGATKPQLPLPTSYQPPAQGSASPQGIALPSLTEGQIVRLTPILPSPVTSATEPQIAPDSVIASKLSLFTLQAVLITKSTTDALQKSLIQTIKPLPGAISQQILTQTNVPVITAPGRSLTPTTIIPKNDFGIAQLLQGILGGTTETPDGIIPATNTTPRLLQLDVKIIDIKLPNVQLTPQTGAVILPATPIKADVDTSFIKPQNAAGFLGDARPAILTAIVTGFTPQNLPIVTIQWPNGSLSQNFTLQFAAGNLQTGSQITLIPQIPAAGATLPPLPTLRNPLQAATPWPVLDDMYQTLMQVSPQSAQGMVRILPSPSNGSNMGAAALLFIASIRAGDLGNWLGEKRIGALGKAIKGDFLSHLTGDTAAATRATPDTSADWRTYPLPLLWQNEISKVMFHLKHDGGDVEQEDKEGSTRFVMDLSLTRMGDVQLDGMLRDKRLDLIVRTQIPISGSMQLAMKNAYTDALEGTEMHGDLVFQGDMKQWMHVVKRDDHLAFNA